MLHKVLEKLGIKGYDELSPEERKTYEQWGQMLAQPDVTLDDLKKFIPLQLSLIENELLSFDNSKEKDLFLKAQVRNLKMIHAFILGPEQRRKWAQEQINKLTNK